MKTFLTCAGQIKSISWNDFVSKVIHKRKSYNIVEQYNMQTKIPTPSSDGEYVRRAISVVSATKDNFKKQFLEGCKDAPIYDSKILNAEIVEEAVINCFENFGLPSHLVKIKNNLYAVVDSSIDSIQRVYLSPRKGALIVYAPNKIAFIRIKK